MREDDPEDVARQWAAKVCTAVPEDKPQVAAEYRVWLAGWPLRYRSHLDAAYGAALLSGK